MKVKEKLKVKVKQKERTERWRYGNQTPLSLFLLLNNYLIEVFLSFCFQQVDMDDEYEEEEEPEEGDGGKVHKH